MYIPYLNRPERIQLYYGSAGSGKSRFLATKHVLDLFREKIKLLVVRQTFASIRDSVHQEFVTVLEDMKLINYVHISKTTLTITFPNGSVILFKGCEDEHKLLSISGVDSCWIEEASQVGFETWNQLLLRLRGGNKKKKFYLSFNPTSASSWLKREFFDNPMEDSIILKTTYKDNRFLDSDYIASLEEMKVRNPEKYEIFGNGNWGTTGKRVFDNWEIKDFNLNKIIKSNPDVEAVFGMDFGYTADPSTLVATLVDLENRVLYIFDEMYEKGLLNNELAERINEMGYSKELIVADSSEKKSIEEIRRYGIPRIKPALKGNGSIMAGIQFIQQFKIYIHPKCKFTIEEFRNYSHKKDKATGEFLNQFEDSHNHCIDSLRYSLEQFSRRNKAKFWDKSAFGF